MRRPVILLMLAAVAACDPNHVEEHARIAASVRPCGFAVLEGGAGTERLIFRVSQYSAGIPSDDVNVIQICKERLLSCSPLAVHQGALGPLLDRTSDGGLSITLRGGYVEQLRETIWIDGQEAPIRLVHLTGRRSDQDIDEFQALVDRQFQPGGLHCRNDLPAPPPSPGSLAN